MTVNVPMFHQSSGMTSAKVYYSNTRHHFCTNSALLPLKPIWEKIPNVTQGEHIFP